MSSSVDTSVLVRRFRDAIERAQLTRLSLLTEAFGSHLGEGQFASHVHDLESSVELLDAFSAISDDELGQLPMFLWEAIVDASESTATAIENARGVAANSKSMSFDQIASAVASTNQRYSGWIEALSTALTFVRRKSLGDSEAKRVREAAAELQGLSSIARETLDHANAAREAANAAAVQSGVTRQGHTFRIAVARYAANARFWAIGAGVAAGFLLAAVALAIFCPKAPPLPHDAWTVAANLSYFAARALGVSVLSFAMVVCVRNYRAAAHNEVLNGHRWRAMAAFRQFREGTEGRTAEIVVLQAATAVFEKRPTGFSAVEPAAGTHLTELLKDFNSGKGSNE